MRKNRHQGRTALEKGGELIGDQGRTQGDTLLRNQSWAKSGKKKYIGDTPYYTIMRRYERVADA